MLYYTMDLFPTLQKKVNKQSIPPRILTSKFRFMDDNISHASADPYYLPFYYYLGTELQSKSLLEFGFGIGLSSGCFLMGCKSVECFLAIQEPGKEYYSPRLGRANIKMVYRKDFFGYVGNNYDIPFVDRLRERKWDMAILNDKANYDDTLSKLNLIWDNLAEDGYICVDHVKDDKHVKLAFQDFGIMKRREPQIFSTRYGTGLIRR